MKDLRLRKQGECGGVAREAGAVRGAQEESSSFRVLFFILKAMGP